jgi:hypothetical protein
MYSRLMKASLPPQWNKQLARDRIYSMTFEAFLQIIFFCSLVGSIQHYSQLSTVTQRSPPKTTPVSTYRADKYNWTSNEVAHTINLDVCCLHLGQLLAEAVDSELSCPSFLGFQIVPADGCRLFDGLVLGDTIDMYSCSMSEGWEA